MISPLWALNSLLAVLGLVTLGFIFFTQERIPPRVSIKPSITIAPPKKEVSKIDIARIYQNDLFNTYITPTAPLQPEEKPKVIPLPIPPKIKPVTPLAPPQPVFLPPLSLILKGVILTSLDTDSRAIVADTKTNKEALYKIGDTLEDAELIYIGKNNVIFIRSNGQQETVFLSGKDAQKDPIYLHEASWDTVVRKISDSEFMIDPITLKERITSLAQLLDMLDVTAVFIKAKEYGCRIGKLEKNSFGRAIGLEQDDVITTVNHIPTNSTQQRIAIYETVKNLPLGAQIIVTLIRNGEEKTITLSLARLTALQETVTTSTLAAMPRQTVTRNEQAMRLLTSSPELDETVKSIKKRDRLAMTGHGGRRNVIQRISE